MHGNLENEVNVHCMSHNPKTKSFENLSQQLLGFSIRLPLLDIMNEKVRVGHSVAEIIENPRLMTSISSIKENLLGSVSCHKKLEETHIMVVDRVVEALN